MKTLKSYRHLSYIILFASLIFSILLYSISPRIITQLAFINWVALLLAAIILITPWGSIRITKTDDKQQKLLFKSWLLKIVLLELAVILLYIGMGQFSASLFSANQAQMMNQTQSGLTESLHEFGLFPWAIIAVFAVCFYVVTFIQKRDSYFDTIAFGTYKKQIESLNVSIKGIGRGFTLATLAIASGMVTIAIASLIISPEYVRAVTGFNLAAFGAALVLFFLTLRKTSSVLMMAAQTQRPAIGFFLSIIIWSIFLIIYSFFAHGHTSLKPEVPTLLQSLLTLDSPLHWQVFSSVWWFIVTPMLAISIARFSYGYSLRAIVLGVLSLPLILALLFIKNFHFILHLPTWGGPAFIIVGFILLLALTVNKHTLPLLSQTYLAKSEIKHRSENVFTERWKRVCGLFFYLFIPGGIAILSLLTMALVIPAVLVIIAVLINAVRLLRRTQC